MAGLLSGERGNLWIQAGLALMAAGLLWRVNVLHRDLETAQDAARTWQISAASREAVARGLADTLRRNDAVLAAWERDRATLDTVSQAARQMVREALRDDAAYQAWGRTSLPAVLAVNGGLLGLGGSRGNPAPQDASSLPAAVSVPGTFVERAHE